jgi:type VI secretion system protein VasG
MPEGEALEQLLLPELQKHFKPAFVGRTTVLPFMPLNGETLSGIVDLQIERIRQRVGASYGTAVTLSPEARDALVARAKSSEMGARAIEVMIARDLLPILSTFFLDAIADGLRIKHIVIAFDGQRFGIEAEQAAPSTKFVEQADGRKADEEARGRKRARGSARKANAP